MSASRSKKKNKAHSAHKKKPLRTIWISAAIIIFIVAVAAYWLVPSPTATNTGRQNGKYESSRQLDYSVLIGRWRRPDGGYIIDIRHIDDEGRIDAAYYNPNPIYVSRAQAEKKADAINVFIELTDTGYPGAVYQLLYYPQQNTLAGSYHQPAAQRSFDVIFVRAQ